MSNIIGTIQEKPVFVPAVDLIKLTDDQARNVMLAFVKCHAHWDDTHDHQETDLFLMYFAWQCAGSPDAPKIDADEAKAQVALCDRLVPTQTMRAWKDGEPDFQGRCYEGYMGVVCSTTAHYVWQVHTHFLEEGLEPKDAREIKLMLGKAWNEAGFMPDQEWAEFQAEAMKEELAERACQALRA